MNEIKMKNSKLINLSKIQKMNAALGDLNSSNRLRKVDRRMNFINLEDLD